MLDVLCIRDQPRPGTPEGSTVETVDVKSRARLVDSLCRARTLLGMSGLSVF